MSVINPPGYMQNLATHTAQVDRLAAVASGMSSDGAGLTWRQGVRGWNDMVVSAQGTPNMTVAVAAGLAFIKGTENALQGLYSVPNDASFNVTISAANATLARRDLIIVRVQDSFYSTSNNLGTIEVVTGTAAASPADPSTPANSLILARVTVAAAATSINAGAITDLRQFTAGVGGLTPIATVAGVPAPATVPGLAIFVQSLNTSYISNGSFWVPLSPNNSVNVNRIVANSMTFNNPVSYSVFNNGTERSAATTSLYKLSAGSALLVRMTISLYLQSGVAQNMLSAMRISGTDYPMAIFGSPAATFRSLLTAEQRITGIGAGSLSIEPVIASGNAAQVIMYATGDTISYTVTEVA